MSSSVLSRFFGHWRGGGPGQRTIKDQRIEIAVGRQYCGGSNMQCEFIQHVPAIFARYIGWGRHEIAMSGRGRGGYSVRLTTSMGRSTAGGIVSLPLSAQ